jgi:hypothetical protein
MSGLVRGWGICPSSFPEREKPPNGRNGGDSSLRPTTENGVLHERTRFRIRRGTELVRSFGRFRSKLASLGVRRMAQGVDGARASVEQGAL